jgi:hypothetical protein
LKDGAGLAFKIRILSYHYIQNNGAFLFAYSLTRLMRDGFPDSDVKIFDYKSIRLRLYEYFKRFKLLPGIPLFYVKRALLWDSILANYLDLDTRFPRFTNKARLLEYFADRCDALVVGMDVWCIVNSKERLTFPNVYWLPGKLTIPKIAYGVSAYNSDPALIQHYSPQITEYLNDFDVIGARDRFTYGMVLENRTLPGDLIDRISDPTFLYEFVDTSTTEKLASFGVNFNQPLVGLMLFGDDELSRKICENYRAKGYQILAMSMYNHFADINLGHLLTPFQWAETFRFLSFCFSDRFHGTLFCLKSGIPFISLEKERHLPITQSKVYDLLLDFDLTQCYMNPGDDNFDINRMLQIADDLLKNWEKSFKPGVELTIQALRDRQGEFIHKMKVLLGW